MIARVADRCPAQVTTLPNGVRVATETIPGAETATVGVYINSGSRFETDATNGVANMLEHVLFKGTKKRSGADLEAELKGMGASLSAFTGREQTSYVSTVLGKDAGKVLDLLGDVMLSPSLEDKAVEKAREVVLAQLTQVSMCKTACGERGTASCATEYVDSPDNPQMCVWKIKVQVVGCGG
eukprot:350856-Chlamydomonas_euryale.AAC.11